MRMMTLGAQEFVRRFLLRILPRGFVRIRSFGFLANRRRANLLPLCQRLLADQHPDSASQQEGCENRAQRAGRKTIDAKP